MSEFRIELDNIPIYYAPGSKVIGQVLFNVSHDEERVTGLVIRCLGRARVEWTESLAGKSKPFAREETYIDETIQLERRVDDVDSGTTILPRGLHTFPFSIQLPSEIPSSFDSDYGGIKYHLEATAQIKPKKKDVATMDTKLEFLVNDVLDLNNYPANLQPFNLRKSKAVWCACCQSGPIGFNLSLSKTGFLPGESVENITELFNLSSRNSPDTHVTLYRDMYFHTEFKTKRMSSTILGDLTLPGVEPGENDILQSSWTIIPRTPPVNLLGCNIITVHHYLKFTMDISLSVNLSGKIPIVIGMIASTGYVSESKASSKTILEDID